MTTAPTPRARARRLHENAAYDRASIDAILDAMPVAHVGYVLEGCPVVTPTLQWREGDRVFWHGSSASRALRQGKGREVCINVTIVDGYVLGRSGFNHSVNSRSVTLFGTAELVPEEEKARHLTGLIEGLWPGRAAMLRPMLPQEVKATVLLSLPIHEASAKIRSGPPEDEPDDYALPIWAGVIPVTQGVSAPISDPRNLDDVQVPEHVTAFTWRLPGA